ncbi:MAG: IS66 family insertion sequence element accessory protein TnpB, partial [Polyangiaceae bacterium]
LKILFFDGSGMCIFYKRLDRGVFRLPEAMTEGAHHVGTACTAPVLDGGRIVTEALVRGSPVSAQPPALSRASEGAQ